MKKQPSIELLDLEKLEKAADCMRIMSHPVRLRIVDILMQGQFPVNQIADFCALPPNQTTEHLRKLKGFGLLDSVRRGRIVYYQIADSKLPDLLNCIRKNCKD
jgi:DNA-binding transcriptional ArsR family regulator